MDQIEDYVVTWTEEEKQMLLRFDLTGEERHGLDYNATAGLLPNARWFW